MLEEANAIAGATRDSARPDTSSRCSPPIAATRTRTLELVRAGHDEHAGVRAERAARHDRSFRCCRSTQQPRQYSDALAATDLAVGYDELDMYGYALAQRIEAAARLGETDIAAEALHQLVERAEASGTDLALGVAARSRALLAERCEKPTRCTGKR